MPTRNLTFEAGQFLSIVIGGERRLYSFASPPEAVKSEGITLCVKLVPGGLGASYLLSLRPGDEVVTYAPYGDFRYRPPESGRHVIFIATGSGIGAIRSILLSERFKTAPARETLLIAGARTQGETPYQRELSTLLPSVFALSGEKAPGYFPGRVTDYLRRVTLDWERTDFYLCGNGAMIREAVVILSGHGVAPGAIKKEVFHSSPPRAAELSASASEASREYASTLLSHALLLRRS